MDKIYTKKIIQYSIEGDIIETHKNCTEASKIISNYDSIINCCKGKYKTAGGYIFRFEGEPFSIDYNKVIEGETHQCKICGSLETIRSMAMHLKWVHSLKTDEYVEKYGEFRPKKLTQLKKKEISKLKCMECGEKLNSNQHLMYHLSISHPEITQSEYILKHLINGEKGLCKCGCGGEVTILRNGKNCDLGKDTYFRDYIKGHWDWEVFSNVNHQSKEETQLLDYVKSIYKGEIQSGVRGLIPKFEIDIYLPELKLGIEYNGLYWHSEKGGRYKDYHLNKLNLCKEKGIRLIQIFSDEWLNKKEIVKSKLQSILKVTPKSQIIYARKCSIKEITPQEKNIFLQKYHIQGSDRSNVKLGIFYNCELVGVMTFSHPRISLGGKYNKDESKYELSRYASSVSIIGGASKLLKYFMKNYNPSQIYSYSDNRWTDSNNNMYLKIGFSKVQISKPGYYYTKDYLTRHHRYNFNKHRLGKMGCDVKNKTEFKIMEEMGYTRVWDCGSSKYELN